MDQFLYLIYWIKVCCTSTYSSSSDSHTNVGSGCFALEGIFFYELLKNFEIDYYIDNDIYNVCVMFSSRTKAHGH